MTVLDMRDQLRLLTDYELETIAETVAKEIDKRAKTRREELKKAFFKAWNDLAEDGATFYYEGDELFFADVEIE